MIIYDTVLYYNSSQKRWHHCKWWMWSCIRNWCIILNVIKCTGCQSGCWKAVANCCSSVTVYAHTYSNVMHKILCTQKNNDYHNYTMYRIINDVRMSSIIWHRVQLVTRSIEKIIMQYQTALSASAYPTHCQQATLLCTMWLFGISCSLCRKESRNKTNVEASN